VLLRQKKSRSMKSSVTAEKQNNYFVLSYKKGVAGGGQLWFEMKNFVRFAV